MRVNYLIAFLLGVIATLLAVIVFANPPSPLFAQTVGEGGGFVAASANYYENGGRNLLWLVNATERGAPKLCLYEATQGRFELRYARNIAYDFMYDQYPARADAQIPSVQDVFNETKKRREKEREATGGASPAGEKGEKGK